MHIFLAVLLCIASGFVVACLGWPPRTPLSSHLLLKVALSAGFGLGVFSLAFFLSRVLSLSSPFSINASVFVLLLGGLLWRRVRGGIESPGEIPQVREAESRGWSRYVPAGAFGIALIGALYALIVRASASPHGAGWDAFAIWNLHARFLFRGGAYWRDGFTALIPWSHPDYPLLVPATIAHFWRYFGEESPWVPAAVALTFTLSTVALLFSGVSMLRGRTQAYLASTVLLATPLFLEQGTSQYADVPLSFFYLATIVLLCLHGETADRSAGWLGLAGFAAAFAAWTKNEGLLFFCAIILACAMILVRREGWAACGRRVVPMLLSALPVLLVIGYFKLRVAPPGDLFSGASNAIHKTLIPARYWTILRWYAKELLRFGHWLLVPGTMLLAAYYFFLGRRTRMHHETAARISIVGLGLTLAGYFAIYVITPYDLYWHLRFSLNRLFLQVWPSAIFLFFLMVQGPWSRESIPASDSGTTMGNQRS